MFLFEHPMRHSISQQEIWSLYMVSKLPFDQFVISMDMYFLKQTSEVAQKRFKEKKYVLVASKSLQLAKTFQTGSLYFFLDDFSFSVLNLFPTFHSWGFPFESVSTMVLQLLLLLLLLMMLLLFPIIIILLLFLLLLLLHCCWCSYCCFWWKCCCCCLCCGVCYCCCL